MDQRDTVSFFKIPNNVESSVGVIISGSTGLVWSYQGADILIDPVACDRGIDSGFCGKF